MFTRFRVPRSLVHGMFLRRILTIIPKIKLHRRDGHYRKLIINRFRREKRRKRRKEQARKREREEARGREEGGRRVRTWRINTVRGNGAGNETAGSLSEATLFLICCRREGTHRFLLSNTARDASLRDNSLLTRPFVRFSVFPLFSFLFFLSFHFPLLSGRVN